MNTNKILWDWGTAYDLFCSLRVLHEPGHYGLRPSWAAGVRSRLPAVHREILEQVHRFIFIPKKWIFGLPGSEEGLPKNGEMVLWYLSQLSPEDRLIHLIESSGLPSGAVDILRAVSLRGSFTIRDQDNLRDAYPSDRTKPRPKNITAIFEFVSRSGESGERYLAALKAYQRVFYAEEENRIQPLLKDAVLEAQALASQLSLEDLIEKLSRGVRIGVDPSIRQWIFVPSYWISPLVSIDPLEDGNTFFIFGGRPADVSLVPGENVPEGLLRAFKAIGDPTRLRILKYLAQENITPAEIARRLRLRAPTVTHHLNVLRLAGLVNLTLEDGNDRQYTARMEAIKEIIAGFDDFLADKTE